jgi:hypothetical protein
MHQGALRHEGIFEGGWTPPVGKPGDLPAGLGYWPLSIRLTLSWPL